MARMRITGLRKGVRTLLSSAEAETMISDKGQAIADACNADSTWGGYYTAANSDGVRARAIVWSADGRNDEGRDNRLVRNLDAGS